jgi:hypothetical protein
MARISIRNRCLLLAGSGAVLAVSVTTAQATPGQTNHSPLTNLALNSVAIAPGATSAWAVGNSITDGQSASILHRASSGWHPVSYTAPTGTTDLSGVAAGSARSIWAVGDVQNAIANTDSELLLHSSGGAFAPVQLPGATVGATLIGVAASSATNAWAIGNNSTHGIVPWGYRLERTGWKKVALPSLPAEYQLESVTTSGPTNTWILALGPGNGQAIVLRWNGKSWSKPKLTGLPKTGDATAVATSSAKNTWVVGFTQTSPSKSFSLHWTGARWSSVAVPRIATDLLAVATTGVTAVAAGNGNAGPVALHYARGAWHAERTDKHGQDAQLHGVAESAKLSLAVGSDLAGSNFEALIDVRAGTHWKRTAA